MILPGGVVDIPVNDIALRTGQMHQCLDPIIDIMLGLYKKKCQSGVEYCRCIFLSNFNSHIHQYLEVLVHVHVPMTTGSMASC